MLALRLRFAILRETKIRIYELDSVNCVSGRPRCGVEFEMRKETI